MLFVSSCMHTWDPLWCYEIFHQYSMMYRCVANQLNHALLCVNRETVELAMHSVPWVLLRELMLWLTVGTESHSASKTSSTAQVSYHAPAASY